MEVCDRHASARALWRAEHSLTLATLTLCGHCKDSHENALLREGFYFVEIATLSVAS
jgi:AhpD family alkylhydroperoxidase